MLIHLRSFIKQSIKRLLPWPLRKLLSARIVIAFILFLGVSITFTWLAKEVRDNDTLHFDNWILLHIHALSRSNLSEVIRIVTQLGGVVVVPAVTFLLATFMYFKISRVHAALLLTGVIGSSLLNLLLKTLFGRVRPNLWEQIVTEHSFSFPSGHAMASMSLAASITASLWFSRWRKLAIFIGTLYVLIIGFTRLYLGVHYPTDIVAGWLIALSWVSIVWILFADTPSSKQKITSPPTVDTKLDN